MKRFLKRTIGIVLIIFLIVSVVPYALPISNPAEYSVKNPFNESNYEIVNNTTIHYRQWLPQSSELKGKIMMIHGMGGSSYSWLLTVQPLLEQGYMVVAVDLPGFGYSDRQQGLDHSQSSRSNMMWQVIDNIDKRLQGDSRLLKWYLMGHSMGGGTVAAMISDHPEKIKAAILVAGALSENNPSQYQAVLKYPPVRRWIEVVLYMVALQPKRIESFLTSAYGRRPTESEVEGYLMPLKQPGTSSIMIDLLLTSRNEPLERIVGSDVPITGIWGSEDTWVPVSEAENIQKLIPDFEYRVIEGSSHCPMETHPNEFNRILAGILDEN
ncbi:MAG: alpha/beta hydrolase [Eubacteriales bacterium]|nr:alpha/beta hydrolase [Eubacteriales bacterium]